MPYEGPKIIPSGTMFAQFQAGGASGHLERLIAANSAGWNAIDYQLVRAAKDGNLEDVYRRLRQIAMDFNNGSPIEHAQVVHNIHRVHNAFAMLDALCMEIGVLVANNPGEIVKTGNTLSSIFRRVWS